MERGVPVHAEISSTKWTVRPPRGTGRSASGATLATQGCHKDTRRHRAAQGSLLPWLGSDLPMGTAGPRNESLSP